MTTGECVVIIEFGLIVLWLALWGWRTFKLQGQLMRCAQASARLHARAMAFLGIEKASEDDVSDAVESRT